MDGPSVHDASADRPSGKKRARTRWGPNKDDAVPSQPAEHATASGEQPAPASQAPSHDGKDAGDAARRRKKTRWGPGDVKSPTQPSPVSEPPVGVQGIHPPRLAELQPYAPQSAPPGRVTAEVAAPHTTNGTAAGGGVLPEEMAELQEAYRAFRQELGKAATGGELHAWEERRSGSAAQLPPPPTVAGTSLGSDQGDSRSLYVGNIAAHITEEALRALFSSVVPGALEQCTLSADPAAPYQHRGYALVRVRDEAAAQRAIQLLHDYPLGGKDLVVRPKGDMAISLAPSDAHPPPSSSPWASYQNPAAAAETRGAGTAAQYPPSSSAADPAGQGGYDYYSAGAGYPGTGYDSYNGYYAAGGFPGGYGSYGGSDTGPNATPVIPAAPATPVPPEDRPPGTEDDPAYDYAYPAPNAPVVVPLGPEGGSPGDGVRGEAAATAAIQGIAHLAAAVKAEVERREEEELLPPGVEAPGEYAAGEHPPQLFGAQPPEEQQQRDAATAQYAGYAGYDAAYAGYEHYGGYYDPATGMYYDYTGADSYTQQPATEAAGDGQQVAARPNLEPPRIKPRVPRSRQRKKGDAAAAPAEPITVPLPADWEEKQKAKMEEAAAKMAAAAAARAEAAAQGPSPLEKQSSLAGRPMTVADVAKPVDIHSRSPVPRGPSPHPARQGFQHSPSRSPLRFSRSPSPRRPLSRSPSSRGRSFSRSPPPHRRYPSRSVSPYNSPRYQSRSPSPPGRGYRGRGFQPPVGRGRGRGGYGRGGYIAGRGRTPSSPHTRRYSPSPPPHRRYSLSPPPRSRSPSYGDYRAVRAGSRSPSPIPGRQYSRSPTRKRQRYSSPEERSRSPPRVSPPSSPEEGELEEGELELDPREARRLQQQQQKQQHRPGPPPPPRGGYNGGRGRPPPPPPPFGRRGRGGRGGGQPPDYAGEFDFVSGQAVPAGMMGVMPLGMAGMMGMMPMGMMGMMPLGMPPAPGRGGFGRGGGGRF